MHVTKCPTTFLIGLLSERLRENQFCQTLPEEKDESVTVACCKYLIAIKSRKKIMPKSDESCPNYVLIFGNGYTKVQKAKFA